MPKSLATDIIVIAWSSVYFLFMRKVLPLFIAFPTALCNAQKER